VAGLLSLACLIILPFTYRGTVGEVDTMRMVIGVSNSMASDSRFAGYNDSVSFGYYLMLEVMTPLFKGNREALIPVMNTLNSLVGILFTIPFYFLIRRYWNEAVAISSCIILLFIPVWWNTALYGHPMLPSSLFLFLGLLVLALGNSASSPPTRQRRTWHEVGAVGLFAVAFSLRLDIVLLFPLVPVVLWLEGHRAWPSLLRSFIYGAITLVVLFGVSALVRPVGQEGGAEVSDIAQSLAHWHNPARLFRKAASGTSIAAFAWHPLFVLLTLGSGIQLARSRQFKPLAFVGIVILVNFFFWMANPSPARHYVYAAPCIALAIAFLLVGLADRLRWNRRSTTILLALSLGLSSLLLSEVFLPVAQRLYPWKFGVQDHSYRVPIRSMVVNQRHSQNAFLESARLGQELLALPAQDRPLLVISDYPLAIGMEMALHSDIAAQGFRATRDSLGRGYAVQTEVNQVIMPDVFLLSIDELLARHDLIHEFRILIDPNSMVGKQRPNGWMTPPRTAAE